MPPRLHNALGATEVQSSSFICMQTRFQVPGTFSFPDATPHQSRKQESRGDDCATSGGAVS
jgi:hypothetical protein